MLISLLITILFVLLGLIKRNSKIVTVCLLFLIYILFAFEKSEGDYLEYVKMYNQIGYGNGYALTYEVLYVWLSKVGNSFGFTFEITRGIIAIFEVFFLYHTIKKYTPNTAMVLSLFMVFPAMIDAELFRFLLGMCIIIFGLQFLIKARGFRDYLVYFVTLVLASLIHSSFWIFAVFYLLVIKDTKKLLKIVIISLAVGLVITNTGLYFSILSKLPIRTFIIEKYQTGNYANSTGMIVAFFKQILMLSMAMVANKIIYFENGKLIFKKAGLLANVTSFDWKNNNEDFIAALEDRILGINYIAFLLMIPLSYSSSVQRLTHVIVFFDYIALAHRAYTDKKNHYVIYALLVSVVLLLILLFIESSGSMYALSSNFTDGYLINLFKTIFGE